MLSRLLVSAALGAGLTYGTALAQSQSSTQGASGTQAENAQTLPQELKKKLENQGFSDVQVVPGSYIVTAKDKQGDSITAIIGPNSMTVFSMSTSGGGSTTGSGAQPSKGGKQN